MTPRPQQPWEIALHAQNEIYGFESSWEGIEYMKRWLGDRLKVYGIGAVNPSEVALRLSEIDMQECEPLYVTQEMQHLVYHAMETFDRTEQVHEDDFFLKSGFAYLAEPFYSLDTNGNRVCWRAIQWVYDEMWTAVTGDYLEHGKERLDKLVMTARQNAAPGTRVVKSDFKFDELDPEDREILENLNYEAVVRIILWSHIDDEDDYPQPPEVYADLKSKGDVWGIAHATAIPVKEISSMEAVINDGDMKAAWLTFLRVMNRLMAERIVVRTPQKAPRPLRRASQRLGNPREGVIVVELRRRSYDVPPGDGEHRNYSHRFIRHGHWRRQPYGPGRQFRRQRYIEDMIIGPKDKPLLIKDRVWVWKD